MLAPIAERLGNPAVRQFAEMVERYVGWDFVGYYLPYIEWIESPQRTLEAWQRHPWPTHLVGAVGDTVIPEHSMAAEVSRHAPDVRYHRVEASHYQALDMARPIVLGQLATLLEQVPVESSRR